MTETFANWFCLKSDRTFMVQPQQDPEFYFGRAELARDILERLERQVLLMRVPKMVIFGAYGAGKTHTLYHVKWYLDHHEDLKFEVRYVETPPDLHRKSKYSVLHQAMMDKIGLATVRRLVGDFITTHLGSQLNQDLLEYFYQDEDLVNVVRIIAQGGPQELNAWRWLRGEALGDPQLQNIGVARAPDLADLINIIQVLGRLFYDIDDSRLVFLIDELEQLLYVTGEEISTWETAFRKLADQDNLSVGFFFASRGAASDEFPSPLQHDAFVTRVKESNFVEIPHLHDVQDVEAFVKDLVAVLVDADCAKAKLDEEGVDTPLDLYPFTPEGLEVISQYIQDDITRALPRELLFSLNECGAAAVGKSVVVTEEIAQEVLA
jgi:hypothetical protein